ncbi:helix-turn-helix domain-containing protein [Actinacidiphila yeochonensis]|uniref:helix-turn-helix domain-containing protein n=1 Tax=Actinacidiphila yeochonensis TaxID=89050 RepID=UPI00068DCD98|nr:helix-turn-helix transcriptional regulator [Actinacidiphila yeochonensis]
MDSNSNSTMDDGESVSARKVYHSELARQRERSGLSLGELNSRTKYDPSYLFRLENGERLGSIDAARVLDRYYDTGNLIVGLWKLAKREGAKSRYEGFMEVEAEAGSMQQFVAGVIPGLLQTERYAQVQLGSSWGATEEQCAEWVRERMARQERILGTANLLTYRVLIDESALRRRLPDDDAWTEQLERLIHAAQLPHVTVHLVDFASGPHPMLGGSLTLLWLPSGRNIAYLEGSVSGQLIEESEEVETLRLAYDQLRDFALSPERTLAVLRSVLEDHTSCSSQPQS